MEAIAEYFTWEPMQGGVRITKLSSSCMERRLTVPDTLGGQPVRGIGSNVFAEKRYLKKIELPSSVVEIDAGAFKNCKGITEIVVPEGVTRLADGLFEGCSGLLDFSLAKGSRGIREIGARTFKKCKALKNVSLGNILETIGESAFDSCFALKQFVALQRLRSIGAGAFAGCVSLSLFTLPNTLAEIGEGAFAGCSALKDFKVFSDNPYFQKIGNALFSVDGSRLICYPCGDPADSYLIPLEVSTIAPRAFEGCAQLYSLTIGAGVREIGDGAFRGCKSLTTVKMSSSVSKLGEGAFENCGSLETITLPHSLKKLPKNLFSGCLTIRGIEIPEGVTEIDEGAFEDCPELRKIAIPGKVRRIGKNAFNGCSMLREAVIPASVEIIEDGAFQDCVSDTDQESLLAIEIPEGVRELGAWAFADCSWLQTVRLPSTLEKIGLGAFAFCSRLSTIALDSRNPNYACSDGILYTKDMKRLVCCPAGRTQRVCRVPDSVEVIDPHAFAFCENLAEIELPASVQQIGAGAFGASLLVSIKLPEGITEVPEGAFWGCRFLETITLPSTVRRIGARAFRSCDALSSFVAPDGATEIGDDAFYACSALRTVMLPKSLATLGKDAFAFCPSLTSVEISSENRAFRVQDGVLLDRNGREAVFYPAAKTDPFCAVPDSVMTIRERTFSPNPHLKTLELPKSVMEIEPNAIGRGTTVRVHENSWAHKWALSVSREFELIQR